MKKITRISTISVWVVNIAIGLISIGSLYSYFMLLGFTGEGKRPDSTEGIEGWSSQAEIKVGDYYLTRVSEYKNGEFQDYIKLRVPHPRIYFMDGDAQNSSLEILPRTNTTLHASYEDQFTIPVVYEFSKEQDTGRITRIFAVYLTVSLVFTLFILITFRRFLLSLSKGEFFTRLNSRRMILLGAASFVLPLFEYIGGSISRNYFVDNFRVINGGIHFFDGVNLTPVVFGVVFLLLSGMIYEGSRLKEDSDLTI